MGASQVRHFTIGNQIPAHLSTGQFQDRCEMQVVKGSLWACGEPHKLMAGCEVDIKVGHQGMDVVIAGCH